MGFGFYVDNILFSVVPILVTVGFAAVFVLALATCIRGVERWSKNNRSPRLTVAAKVVDKRTEVTHHHHDTHMHVSTSCYVTFEVESGDRMELLVPDRELGYLVVGDQGRLTFQGTRYVQFERTLG